MNFAALIKDLKLPQPILDSFHKKRTNDELKVYAQTLPQLLYPDTYKLAGKLLIYLNIKTSPSTIRDYIKVLSEILNNDIKKFFLKHEKIINKDQAINAKNSELQINKRDKFKSVEAQYFLEDVRKKLIEKYGEDKLYKGGLTVRTSLDPRLQKIADNTLKYGLINYDLRHGWRGPLANVNIKDTNLKFSFGLRVI